MRDDPGESNQRQAHRNDADDQAPPLEPGSHVDSRAKLIDVGQPGPGHCCHRQAHALEGPRFEGLSRCQPE